MNIELLKTDSGNIDFINLIKLLDQELDERYGELQRKYDQHNRVDFIGDVVVIYKNKVPAACGAFKEHNENTIELKRIFVSKEYRQQGFAKLIVKELENTAMGRGYKYAVLQTAIKQPEAINLYKKCGYEVIENYGPYAGDTNSVCMRKKL
ncbi:MAG: GNAT family N-acetyltransferase [Bacillota bacterium]|nr:GNAT family N-acetyltransferase [Bacillota bacterium]